MKSGIYMFKNLINGKRYIGSAIYLIGRRGDHLCMLRDNTHHNIHFQRSFNKHGEEVFVWGVLEYCSENELMEREQYYIDLYNPEYNICKNAYSSIGVKRSEETCKKIGLSKIGNKNWLGKERDEETKSKISKSLKGKCFREKGTFKHSNKTKQLLSDKYINYRTGTSKYGKVIQLDLKDNELNIFNNPQEAAQFLNKPRAKAMKIIHEGCKKQGIIFGYKWKLLSSSKIG